MDPAPAPGVSIPDVTEPSIELPPTPAAAAEVTTRSHRWRASTFADRLFLIAVVAVVVPVAVATARAIHRGWVPVGDHAFFTIRARDLFTLDHLPLLGTWSSASLIAGDSLNHPGPLLFDVLAVPAKLGGGTGLAIGVAVINGISLLGIAIVGYRRGGAVLGTVAVTMAGALAWSMGSELLYEPWQPHVLLLPFLFFVTLVWAVACGDLVALPWMVGVGSFVVQTHLTYAMLVPLLSVWAIVGLALKLRDDRRRDASSWPALRRRAIRMGITAAVVFVVCWIQPLIEQFTSDGDGNLTRLVQHARNPQVKTVGFDLGTRVVAAVVSLPPWLFRPSFGNTFASHQGWRAPSLGLAIGSLAALAGVLGWCAWVARRRHNRDVSRVIVTAAIALVAGLITAGRTPVTTFGIEPHAFRWLWPVAAFIFFALAASGLLAFKRWSGQITGFCVLVAVVLGLLNLPISNYGGGPNTQQFAIAATDDLNRKMGALEGNGPLLIDNAFLEEFANPYSASILAELQERKIPFVAKDDGLVRQLGPARRYNGHNARNELFMRMGDAGLTAPPGSRLAIRGNGLTAAERHELSGLRRRISEYLRAGRLRLNRDGRAALASGRLPILQQQLQSADGVDPNAALDSYEVVVLVDRHYAVLQGIWAERFERYAELRKRFEDETVSLFVRPLTSQGTPPASSESS